MLWTLRLTDPLTGAQQCRADLIDLLDTVKAEGKLRTANVLLSDLKQMFRFALMRDLVPRNPPDTVSKRVLGNQWRAALCHNTAATLVLP